MVVHFTYTSPTYSTVVSSGWYICLTFITNTYHGQWWSILRTHFLHIQQWWALGGLYVSHLLQTLTMDNGGPFYIHISYIFHSGELWVVDMYMSHIYYKHLPWTVVVHFTYTSSTYSTVVSSGWYICLTFITNTYHGQRWSILCTHLLHILQWWALGGIYVSHLLLTLTMDSGGPFYVHISYIFYSGELWVVYMSHIYNKHLPWTMVVHVMYTSPTYSTVVSSGWSICLTFITNTCHGQWWSILRTHFLHIQQWWALGGLYVSHLLQTLTMDNGGPF